MGIRASALRIAVIALLVIASAMPVWSDNGKTILVLNSYHNGYAWSDEELTGLTGRLKEVYPEIEIYIEYLDSRRRTEEADRNRIKKFLIEKYRGQKFHLLVVLDDPAFEMLTLNSKELFPGTPVVFAGIGDFSKAMISGRDNITGIVETLDIKGTLATALRLHPKATEVLIINDDTISGIAFRRKTEALVPLFAGRVSLRFNAPGSFQDVRNEIDALPENAIALIVSHSTDTKGQTLSHDRSAAFFSSGSAKPIYTVHAGKLGHGTVGGHLLSGLEHGRRAADIGLRVLAGEAPSAIPVDYSGASKPMFDHEQIRRFSIDKDRLPSGSVIINRPVSVFDSHRDFAIGILLAVILLAVLVVLLSVSIVRRRRAEAALMESQRRLADIIDFLPDATFAVDIDRRIIAWNRAIEDMTGVRAENMLGKGNYEYSVPFYGVRKPTMIDLAFHCDSETEKRYVYLHKEGNSLVGEAVVNLNGENRILWGKISKLYDSSGNITGAIEILRDITEREKAERELMESRQRLSELIDFLPDATFAIDRQGKVISWNRAIEEMTGIKSEDMIGKGDFEYALPLYGTRRPILIDMVTAYDEEIWANYYAVRREGFVLMAETTATIKGQERFLWGKAAPSFDNNGNMTGCIEIIRDITEYKRSEQEQVKLRDLLFQSQKMETVGLLAGGIANDFSNLLTPILGYSDLMLIGLSGSDPKRMMIEEIQQCAERAKDLTKRLLAFSRKQIMELKVVNLGDIVSGFQPVLNSVVRDNVQTRLDIDPETGLVRADREQIEQALLNLVANAQDAMPDGGLLTIGVRNFNVDESYKASHVDITDEPYVMLSIGDTGMGMDKETQKHIFEPFFTTKKLGRGSGLGLATVYGIIKQHCGSISVYSEKNKGSVFQIILPRVNKDGQMIDIQPDGIPQQRDRASEGI